MNFVEVLVVLIAFEKINIIILRDGRNGIQKVAIERILVFSSR
jgi:hypothetical protein